MVEGAFVGRDRPPRTMDLAGFLTNVLGGLRDRGVPHCILRNYEGLPERNVGNDIDILLGREHLADAIGVFRQCPGTVVTGFVERAGGVSVFLSGVRWDDADALQVDLIHTIAWKGLPIADAGGILARCRRAPGRPEFIRIPSPADEACVSFLSSYLVGGFVKEKYQPRVREVFSQERDTVEAELAAAIGLPLATALAGAVVADDRARLASLLPVLRRSILLRAFARAPLRSARRIFVHYAREAIIRFTTTYQLSVCLLGPDGAGKTTVVETLRRRLVHCAKSIVVRHLKPDIFFRGRRRAVGPVTDPHGLPPRSAATSVLKIVLWAGELWLDRLFKGRRNPTLEIWDRYYHDLLVDPARYRYGGPMWLARWIGRLVPMPGLFVVLDAPPEILRQRKREVAAEETARQRDAYLALAAALPNAVVVNAAGDPRSAAEGAVGGIIAYLAARAADQAGGAR